MFSGFKGWSFVLRHHRKQNRKIPISQQSVTILSAFPWLGATTVTWLSERKNLPQDVVVAAVRHFANEGVIKSREGSLSLSWTGKKLVWRIKRHHPSIVIQRNR